MAKHVPFKQSFKILFKSKRFIALALAFSGVNGAFNVYGSIMQTLLSPYGFTSD